MTSTNRTITAPAKDWIRALAVVGAAASRRPPVPILNGVLLTHSGGKIAVQAFDYETAASTELDEATVEGFAPDESVLVSRHWLYATIKSTTGRQRSAPVKVTTDGEKVTLEACGYSITSEGMPASEYPTIPQPGPINLTVTTNDLVSSIKRVATAASIDETLPILTGIQFQITKTGIRFYSTDRYRLSTDAIAAASDVEGRFLLPAKKLVSILPKLDGETVDLSFNSDTVSIQSGRNTFVTKPIDGDYPKLGALFPDGANLAVEADRLTLMEATRVAISLAPRNVPCILRIDQAGATVTFSDGLWEESKAPKAPGALVIGNEPTVVAFNPGYLLDALQSVKTDKVRISMTTAPKPWVFTPEGVDSGNQETYRYLLMPVRLPQN